MASTPTDAVFRHARPEDGPELARLAALDSAEPLAGPALVAESGGRLVAAVSLSDGTAVADPFEPTARLVELLRVQARELGAPRPRPRARAFARRAVATTMAVAALAAGAAAEPALADRYVSKTGTDVGFCTLPSSPCLTIDRAADFAGPGETVHIGPGTYVEALEIGKRIYLAGSGSGEPDDFTSTTDTALAAPNGAPGLRMTGGGGVRDMRIVGGYDNTFQGQPPVGLDLESSSANPVPYEVRRVVAIGGLHDSSAYLNSGVALYTGGLGTNGKIDLEMTDSYLGHSSVADAGWPLIRSWAEGTADLRNVQLDSKGTLGQIGRNSHLMLTGASSPKPALSGLTVDPGGRLTLSRSRIVTHELPLQLMTQSDPTRAEVRDSLVAALHSSPYRPAIWVQASQLQGTPRNELLLSGSTVVSHGANPVALQLDATQTGESVAHAENTILRAFDPATGTSGRAVRAEGTLGGKTAFTASYSAFGPVLAIEDADVAAAGSGTNIAADPGFADEAGLDLTLAAGSPLIDAGDPAVAGVLDLAGSPRSLDGDGRCGPQPDIGAYERAAVPDTGCGVAEPPPAADVTAPLLSALRADPAAIRAGGAASRRRRRAPAATELQWELSEAARITFSVKRAAKGRRQGGGCKARARRGRRCTRWVPAGQFTVDAAAGAGEAAFTGKIGRKRLQPGRYRLSAVATDAAGNESAVQLLKLRILSR